MQCWVMILCEFVTTIIVNIGIWPSALILISGGLSYLSGLSNIIKASDLIDIRVCVQEAFLKHVFKEYLYAEIRYICIRLFLLAFGS